MTSIFVLFIAFVALGVISQKYAWRTRLLVLLVAASMVVYVTITSL
ncbi:MAG: hypothetical protein ACRDIV_15360 [Ktedonobacteraceae bacterium]